MNWHERLFLGRRSLVTATVISAVWVVPSALSGSLSIIDLVAVVVIFVLILIPARRAKRRAADDSSLYGPPE